MRKALLDQLLADIAARRPVAQLTWLANGKNGLDFGSRDLDFAKQLRLNGQPLVIDRQQLPSDLVSAE